MEEERIRKETEERQKQQLLDDQRRAARGVGDRSVRKPTMKGSCFHLAGATRT